MKQARCANCGVRMDKEHSENWKFYCNKQKCSDAFRREVLNKKEEKAK
jgi:hypothetical protein